MAVSVDSHIRITPGVCGGKPRIAGHRIRVMDVAVWQRMGWTPEEMVAHYPQLALADVYAALAYYWANKEDVDCDLAAEERAADEMVGKFPSPLQEKLRKLSGGD